MISPTTNINDNANSKNLKKKLNYRHLEEIQRYLRNNIRGEGIAMVSKNKKRVLLVISREIVMEIFCFGQNCTKYWTQYLRLLKHDIALKAPRRKILKFRFVTQLFF